MIVFLYFSDYKYGTKEFFVILVLYFIVILILKSSPEQN